VVKTCSKNYELIASPPCRRSLQHNQISKILNQKFKFWEDFFRNIRKCFQVLASVASVTDPLLVCGSLHPQFSSQRVEILREGWVSNPLLPNQRISPPNIFNPHGTLSMMEKRVFGRFLGWILTLAWLLAPCTSGEEFWHSEGWRDELLFVREKFNPFWYKLDVKLTIGQ
jgi:hypothetical protein